ncbi:hypothetical protein [Nocardia sp. NPDC058114]|uniref:hypothetical protein n=1 Tax=Nocardia sp. NPDC058114 TaxID=3346346 RepID=UPI0036DDE2A6
MNDLPVKDLVDVSNREFFTLFAKRTGMYIGYTDLRGVVTDIEGYDMASRRSGQPGLQGWREWLIQRYQVVPDLVWAAQINQIALPDWDFAASLTAEQETHVLTVLFDLLDTFLAERESPRT